MKYGQIILGFLLCLALEYSLYNLNHKYNFWEPIFSTRSILSEEKRSGVGVFTNPLLECTGLSEDDHIGELNISKFDLTKIVSGILKEKKVGFLSVYVRDLNNGPWIGINEKEEFIGGSLLKVPVLMSFLKLSEDDPEVLQKKVEYKESFVSNAQYFASLREIELGKEYTIQDLLENMIYYSDNNASALLFRNIEMDDFQRTFESLGLGRPNPNVPYPVNVKTYAGFFRVLFNSSYLNKANSEKALEMLSKTDFERGLKGKLPENLSVSHKFGIRTENDINQLHDCGIVYYPKHPYLICIMSRDGKFDDLADAIARVSKFVYDEVKESNKK